MGAAGAAGLLLEKQTGDLFRFDEQRRAWAPVGNVGVHCSLGAVDRHGVTSSTGINRSDGVGPCDIIQNARFHFLFEGVWPARLVVPETNEWHCHLPTFDTGIQVPTGSFEVKALATSRLGAQIVECRNLVAVQFRPDERFPQTIRMLHNFVDAKVNLLIGEGGQGEPPRRLLEMVVREPRQYSDLIQSLVRSLAPPLSGVAMAPRPATVGTLSRASVAAPSTAGFSRPQSAASVPNLRGQMGRSSSAGGLGLTRRPESAAAGAAGMDPAGYSVRPEAALNYMNDSRDALKTHAENVHVGRTTKAFASMDGMGATVPLFTTKPPRTSSAPGTSRLAARNAALNMTATADRGASPSPSQLVPRVMAADLVLEDAVTTDKAAVGGPSAAVQRAMAHSQKNAGKPKTKMVRRATGKPFSNYQKYEAKRNALVGHTIHVTSVGPFVSKLEQMNFDEQDKRAASIHKDKYGNYLQFKPGGLWDKWEAPPGGWGFAAAGFLLPDDLPNTHKRYGSFYNVHCHQFRYTKPKQNLYM